MTILAMCLATAAPAGAEVPADLPPAQGVDLGPASYRCSYAAGYSVIDLIIIDAGVYADRAGNRGAYHRSGHEIVFDSGPFAGRPAYVEGGNVYLVVPGGSLYMSCSPGP
ncbi:hypothetical protein D3874_27115 [Oleomonas cavernae]|uniref:Uncharacterized protein n=1 Tax=Oleomonas cavernae TaxID=2320859 RepID=A0A418VUC4_9PROT|nr:hypothetical protein D3874_27115 [Oleomonas cavernae]